MGIFASCFIILFLSNFSTVSMYYFVTQEKYFNYMYYLANKKRSCFWIFRDRGGKMLRIKQ